MRVEAGSGPRVTLSPSEAMLSKWIRWWIGLDTLTRLLA
jgi:hypothetical protein